MTNSDIKSWNNGDSGEYVKEVIDSNFRILEQRIIKSTFLKTFNSSDWANGLITIKYAEHGIYSPIPHVFILDGEEYVDVIDGYLVDSENNVYLQSDIPYTGKVVIK